MLIRYANLFNDIRLNEIVQHIFLLDILMRVIDYIIQLFIYSLNKNVFRFNSS